MNYIEKVELANKYSYHYYTLDDPIATDEEYDLLLRDIIKEEEKTGYIALQSPTKRIGDRILDGFNEIQHLEKMYSLKDAFSNEEMESFVNGIKKLYPEATFYCEPKYDGLSLNLTYENGLLISAGTRGDGAKGENVFENVHHIQGIPLSISYKEKIEIRGEVTIFKSDFECVNREREKAGEKPFKNERNAAAGALRSYSSSLVKIAKLKFTPYGVGYNSLDLKNPLEIAKYILSLGFTNWNTADQKSLTTIEEIAAVFDNLVNTREEFPMLLDGMVIKVNDFHIQEELGFTSKTPKWALAYKFPALEKTTILKNVILQVGKTGVITPVAIIEPTDIMGSTITKATLHNFEEIQKKDIRIGDSIVIIKSGDVIPKIINVFHERRTGNETIILEPEVCPCCGSKTEKKKLFDSEEEETAIRCSNSSCPDVLKAKLEYAVGKKALDLPDVGGSTINALIDKGYISSLIDLFSIKKEQLLELEGFKDKKAQKTIDSIQSAIGLPLERFINVLDIELIGERASIKIADALGIRAIDPCITKEEILSIQDIGEAMANNYIFFMQENIDYVRKLEEILCPVYNKKEIISSTIAGKSFVITGTLSKSRDFYKDAIEKRGAKVSSSVSKKTDYVLVGEDAGSKAEKAMELNIKTIDEAEFISLLCL